MARSTSCTDARMTTVRSMITFRFSAGEIEARNHGRVAFTAVGRLDHVGAGLPENRNDHARLAVR